MSVQETTLRKDTALRMPFPRRGVLNVSPLYAQLRTDTPIVPVTTPTGDPAWVVMAYDEAKLVITCTTIRRTLRACRKLLCTRLRWVESTSSSRWGACAN
jgi:hypothetical protein